MNLSHDQILEIFVAVVSAGVLIQAIIMLAAIIGASKAVKKVNELSDQVRDQVLPTVASSRRMIEEISPKLKVITSNLLDVSTKVRHQATNADVALSEVVEKTRQQAERVDQMLTSTLDAVSSAATTVQATVGQPIRQVNGVLNGLRAGFDVFRGKRNPERVHEDKDLFI